MKESIAIIAALLAVAGNVPYLRDMFKGTVKPHPYTWLVGSVVSCTVFFGMFSKGAGIGVLPTAVSELFTVIIFIFSLKYGFKGIRKIDTLFLVIALAGLALWPLTHDPTYSIIVAVGVDLIAQVPTFRKTWKHPKTESSTLYIANTLRHILSLFSLQTYNIATTLHSIAMIVTNTAMTGIILRKKR